VQPWHASCEEAAQTPREDEVRLKFTDLFAGLGTDRLAYTEACLRHSGKEVEMRGWLAVPHDGSRTVMLVAGYADSRNGCRRPVAAVVLPGFRPPRRINGEVTLRGRLSYGFAVRNGIASHLRLERARISGTFSP
jgi:hypothetical protein